MNLARIAKIKALADDTRGDPATRQRAQEKLEAYRGSYPHLFETPKPRKPPRDPRVYGMRTDPVYEYYLYTDLGRWGRSKNGNLAFNIAHKGINYKIVLFKHKRTDTYGWMRVDTFNNQTEFSGRFGTIGEAQGDAWANLMTKG
jgi:hypothetical protein